MYAQVMEGLQVQEDGTYLDGTFGRGGHARGVLQELGPGGRLLLMDKDPEAIAHAEHAFAGAARVATGTRNGASPPWRASSTPPTASASSTSGASASAKASERCNASRLAVSSPSTMDT